MQNSRSTASTKQRNGAVSPGKQRTGGAGSHSQLDDSALNQSQSQQQFVVLDRDLVRGLSEKEVEIEHLRTQVFAL